MGMRGNIPLNKAKEWFITLITSLAAIGAVGLIIPLAIPELAKNVLIAVLIVTGMFLPMSISMVYETRKGKNESDRRRDAEYLFCTNCGAWNKRGLLRCQKCESFLTPNSVVTPAMIRERERAEALAAAAQKVADEARDREEWNLRLTARPLMAADDTKNLLHDPWVCPVCKEANEPETKQCKSCGTTHPSLTMID